MKIRCISQLFQPLIKIPQNTKIKNTEITCKSQKLLLECGLVRPTGTGFFSILPLARRSLDKLEHIVKSAFEDIGAQRLSLPALTSSSLWEKTGRLNNQTELLQVRDRHGKKYLLAPTHEEAFADLLADVGPLSYKQLPLFLYQITSKYRDEHRPKHGMLRAREFTMLDAYGAHANAECATALYMQVCTAYREIFQKLQLPVVKVQAPSGEMGGSLSHEWQLPAGAGEDEMQICASCSHADLDTTSDICRLCGGGVNRVSSVEVGHTFLLGYKYSDPLNAQYIASSGNPTSVYMCCYGIGLTRLLAASLESLSTEKSLRWPKAIAPYSIVIIGPKEGSHEWAAHGWDSIVYVYDSLSSLPEFKDDVVVDDRHQLTIGKRLVMADKLGYTYILVCGKLTLQSPPRYELYSYEWDGPHLLTLDELMQTLGGVKEAYTSHG